MWDLNGRMISKEEREECGWEVRAVRMTKEGRKEGRKREERER